MMNINIEIADGTRFFHNGREIVVLPEETVANYLKSKAYSHLPVTDIAEIHNTIERQEAICFLSCSLIVTLCKPSQ
ncbi:hypothetical protein [Photobacterium indicum]|uniref:hypothetical protein n=1 Tax=Photobacterium indicum TaxID=81447 RepID=UPI003D12BCBD